MEIGDLVRYHQWIGIVMGARIEQNNQEHTLVRWVTGRHAGDTNAIWTPELEVISGNR